MNESEINSPIQLPSTADELTDKHIITFHWVLKAKAAQMAISCYKILQPETLALLEAIRLSGQCFDVGKQVSELRNATGCKSKELLLADEFRVQQQLRSAGLTDDETANDFMNSIEAGIAWHTGTLFN